MDGKHKDRGRPPAGRLATAWRGLAPLGVASLVALAIGGGVDLVHDQQRASKKERSAKPAAEQDRAPRYVVGIRKNGTALVVRDVRTGRDVGLPVAAPQSQRFQRVAAAGENEYIVSSFAAGKVGFQRLRLRDDGRPSELSSVPGATVPGASTAWSDMAVTADGDKIAYVTYKPGGIGRLDVFSIGTAQHKVWTASVPARVSSLSWAGSTLSFVWAPVKKVNGRTVRTVRALETTASDGDLKVSRPVLVLPPGSVSAVLGPDGRTVVSSAPQGGNIAVQTYTIGSSRPQVLWKQPANGRPTRLDADHTGNHLLVLANDGKLYIDGAQPVQAEDFLDAAW
ncbi:hypothetical protein ACFY4C_36680 [Actinomadura viridis]|uniref:hypothetical protein n=1 Tax=Actinomadura viridis TaxID=58110 RepID=UPI0036C898AC